MAKVTKIELIDDLTGQPIEDNDSPTVQFALDGVDYEIDLNSKNEEKFRKALAPYVEKAHRVGKKTGKRGKRTQVGPPAAEVRAWAISEGMDVPERGRIPQEIWDAYNAS